MHCIYIYDCTLKCAVNCLYDMSLPHKQFTINSITLALDCDISLKLQDAWHQPVTLSNLVSLYSNLTFLYK